MSSTRRVVNRFVNRSTPPRPSSAEHAGRLIDELDGRDVEVSLALARSIIDAGAWRSWMVKRFIRVHRHETSRLMRRLGPMIPPWFLRRAK
jgi:hypothetical protein